MSVPLPPKLNPNCQCICHYQSGVMHVVACCHAPVADLAQASVAAALESAALVMGERQALILREQVADLIRALITKPQHDALAAHVAAEVAKALADERDAANARADQARDDALVAAAYEAAAQEVDTAGDSAVTEALGQSLCCSGYHCGCQGADVGAYLMHHIRALTPDHATEALDRIKADARDAALVEAAGTLEDQALDADAQAKRFRRGSDPWADRTARSRALRNSAAAILALRDKPAPAVTVQEAARVLLGVFEDPYANAPHGFDWQSMYDEMTADHKESLDICGTHDWPSTLIVALRAIAGGGDE